MRRLNHSVKRAKIVRQPSFAVSAHTLRILVVKHRQEAGMDLTRDHVLALLTAHPDTSELAEMPPWLAQECSEMGLTILSRPGVWKLTEEGYRERQSRLAET